MALVLLNSLHSIQFERSIDWRVRIPFLANLEPKLKTLYPNSSYFCQDVEFSLSDIQVSEDDLGVAGSYESKKVIPEVKFSVFSDKGHLIETALRKWNVGSYDDKEGSMALPDLTGSAGAVQEVIIDRIDPVDFEKVVVSLATPLISDIEVKVLDTYKFKGYIEQVPKYIGTNSAEVRVIDVSLMITEYKPYSINVNNQLRALGIIR